jgi:hypothetical protein
MMKKIFAGLAGGIEHKTRFCAVCMLIGAAVLGFADSGDLDVYSQIYNGTNSQQEKLGVLQPIHEENISGAGEFYARSLQSLIGGYQNVRGATEINAANEQLILLAAQVGAERQTASAADLWRVVDQLPNEPGVALVKAEALMALGKLQATAYVPQMIRFLHSLNIRSIYPGDNLSRERAAYGAIVGLEKMADPSAYLEVFAASKAGYSGRITSQAERSLPVVSSDPGPYLNRVIQSAGYSFEDKLIALQSIDGSNLPNDQKAAAAATALVQAWNSITSNVTLLSDLREIRKQGMDMIAKYGTQDPRVPPLLKRSYEDQMDVNEKLSAVAALGKLDSDDAARTLNDFLAKLNTAQKDGKARQEEDRLIRAVITVLGSSRKVFARPELQRTKTVGWGSQIDTLADNALRQLQ